MKQNRLNSWASRLRGMVALSLMLFVSANAMADDKLIVKSNVKAGESGQIAISLDNETAFTAFQVEVVLPEGLTLASSDAVSLSTDRKDASHQVAYNEVETGKVRIVVYSFNGTKGNEAFTGNSGDLLLINVTASSSYDPSSDVTLNEPLFVSKSSLKGMELAYENEHGILGDVDGDGSVTVLDGVAIIDYYLKKNPSPFNVAVADLDNDGSITVLDGVAAIDIYLKK